MANRLEGRGAIEVFVKNRGRVAISQEDSLGNDPEIVEMDLRDVPTIIKWLRQAAHEAKVFLPDPAEGEESK